MNIQIKSWVNGSVLFECDAGSIKLAVELAISKKIDLSSANLRFADLSSANLSFADLSFADLSSANLSSANLRFADLSSANLSSANLRFADLSSANLSSANLNGEILTKSPIFIYGLCWDVMMTDLKIYIGCKNYTIDEWASFNDEEIALMDDNALDFWKEHKTAILCLANAHKVKP
jgi:uncharacterized protein YjbI with pentapeptide repeats